MCCGQRVIPFQKMDEHRRAVVVGTLRETYRLWQRHGGQLSEDWLKGLITGLNLREILDGDWPEDTEVSWLIGREAARGWRNLVREALRGEKPGDEGGGG